MTTISLVSAVLERLQSWFAENSHDSQLTTEGTPENLNSLWSWKDILLQRDADAEKKYLQDEDFRKQVREMMQILYDVENLVESYQVGAISRGNYYRRGCTKSMFRKISDFKANKKFQAELHSLTDQISGLLVTLKDSLPSQQPRESPTSPRNDLVGGRQLQRRYTTRIDPVMDEDIIRMERDEEVLLSHLTSGTSDLEVISIWGMGGAGKTTLARTLYNDSGVRCHFHICAWVTIGPEFRTRDVFMSILDQVRQPGLEPSMRLDEIDLAVEVRKSLLKTRWLLVLDDIWSIEAWNSIKFAFPVSRIGERILVTSRSRDIAVSMYENLYIHELGVLREDETWELFKRKAQFVETELNPEQVQIAKEILQHCAGLPLAVVTLAGILKNKSLDEWKSLLQSFEVDVSQSSTLGFEQLLELSFNSVPSVLKPCLLYMGTFPEGSKFVTNTLYQLWIAEGLVSQKQCRDGETMMDVTAQYFDDLASLSMVQVTEEEMSDHRSFSCGELHDVLLDFCIAQAKKEQFFEIVIPGSANQPADSVFRRVFYLDNVGYMDIRPYLKLDLRTLLFFNSNFHQTGEELVPPQGITDLSNLKWLRILHFDGVKFEGGKLPAGFGNLILLRYLSLRGCYLEEVPSYISNFFFLLTLDLRVRKQCRVTLPNVLFKLEKLRHLYLPLKFQTPDNDKLLLDGMKELEILENFDTSMCNAGEIFLLTSFRSLAVSADGNLKDLEQIFRCIEGSANHLSKTSLDIRNFDCYSEERVSFIKKLLSCRVLHTFQLEGRIDIDLGAISQSFTEIHLNGSQLHHDPMEALEMLPNLRILELGVEAYTGKEMNCSELGFPELRSLKLSKLYNLEGLEVESGALPKLSTLEIENCRRLKMLPEGLESIHTLRTLKIGMMPKGFVGRLRKVDGKGGEDLHKINPYCTTEIGKVDPWSEDSDSAKQISSSTETGDLVTSSEVATTDQCERDVYLQ